MNPKVAIEKIYISFKGDMSVGIWPQHFTMEVFIHPSDIEDPLKELERIREEVKKLYESLIDEGACVEFDFEVEEEARAEQERLFQERADIEDMRKKEDASSDESR